ncbi:5'/3'-nucleotidase SurE [Acinetobacter rathckeae]|uniref:5'/3'-nucleotidase SurE n=1 Tax=Acinetobacter rathckeae TaxID=2605272 RepID=UPI0018A28AB9|nr:5'/3'-nucleotidase SurE [Acinetobacter rathckeae]MBF7687540.1 5'/3'-nucleotidase SurE [Acinetobacter rathckeae]MBF7694942.1 5'/3'-nucleotidase SurE [Acinetobacter rathckeae]
MNILVSNDDGVLAPGIQALAKALKPLGRVVVVAPESEKSGFSSALSLDRPLRPVEIMPDVWAVNGTPADCVYLSMNGLFDFEFDLVVSGINSGSNLGDDVLYSGTVGAAFEGRLMKQPAIAVSLVGQQRSDYHEPNAFAYAAQWAHDFISKGLPQLPERHILNVNIPYLPTEQIRGTRVTYQGQRKQAKPLTSHVDPRGHHVYWIGLAGEAIVDTLDEGTGQVSDFYAINHGYVSVTPIQMDATNYAVLEQLKQSIESLV